MTSISMRSESEPSAFVNAAAPLAEQTERWCAGCDRFVQWERDHILKTNPSAAMQAQHRDSLRLLLRLTRLFAAALAEPDFPDRTLQRMLGHALWKLEQSWRMIYQPMPEAEADKLLAEIFPK